MALRDLSIETMVTIVGAWVSSKRDRSVVEKYPKLAPFLPDLDHLSDVLLSAGRSTTKVPDELAAVRAEIKALDDRHDAVVRGIDDVLSGLANLAPKASTRATLDALREVLLPEGRQVVNWSLRRQGGAAERAMTRLSPTQKKALREMKIPGGTLLGFLDERVKLARQLVDLDRRRMALVAAAESKSSVGTYDATLAFVRTVGLFVAIVEASKVDAADRDRLLGALESALDQAESRRASAQGDQALEEALEDLDASAEAQPAVD